MADDPAQPVTPRPVISIDEADEGGAGLPISPPVDSADVPRATPPPLPPPSPRPVPVMPIAEPGVVAAAPFAQVYSPPPPAGAPPSLTMSPPAEPVGYYPPPATWPGAHYRMPAQTYTRPGLITALAVTGIVVASLGLVGSFFSGCTGLMVMNSAGRAGIAMPVPPAGTATTVEEAGPDGLNAADRETVAQALRSRRHLSAARERQLDAFLIEHGGLVIEGDDDGVLTTRQVTDHLTSTGQEYAQAGSVGADYFVFRAGPACPLPGRLRLSDDLASYEPADGKGETLRSRAKAATTKNVAGAAQTDPSVAVVGVGLDDYQAGAVVARAQALCNDRLNALQVARLQTIMQSPAANNWVNPTPNLPGLTAQVKSTVVQSDGSATIQFVMGDLPLDAGGNPTGPMAAAANASASVGGPVGALAPAGNRIVVSRGSCTLAVAVAVVSAALAIYLLVVAIFTLRQTPNARRLLVIYALAKLPCAAACVLAFAWMYRSLVIPPDAWMLGAIFANGLPGLVTTALVLSAAGAIYPAAVLLALTRSKTVREYYRTGG